MKQLIYVVFIYVFVFFNSSFAATSPLPQDIYEEKARSALERIIKEQIKELTDTVNSTPSSNEYNIKGYVLSTHIRNFSDIPENIDREIQQIRERIRLLIRTVATDIEVNAGNSGTLNVGNDGQIEYQPTSNLPKALNEKRKHLLEANLKNSVSVRSAAMAVRLLAGINDGLKSRAGEANTRQEKERVYMTQAIYVYEMADITLELLNGLTLEGKETIDRLYSDAQQRVEERVSDIERQRVAAKSLLQQGLLTQKQFKQEEVSYAHLKKANEQSLDAWKDLMTKVGKQEDFLSNLQSKKALIAYKRDKAKVQLETLRDLRQVAELRDAIGSLDDLVAAVADLDLLILDEQTVRTLLGYGE